jgi:hypothetical protein
MIEKTVVHDFNRYFDEAAPGVYREQEFGAPRRTMFTTGVPAFIGVSPRHDPPRGPVMLTLWSHFKRYIGEPTQDCFLAYAVRGFFENGGRACYVMPLTSPTMTSLEAGLEAVGHLNTVDLVCAPDAIKDRALAFSYQQLVVNHCETAGDRFAILDTRKGDDRNAVWNQWSDIDGYNGAIYYPWVKVHGFQGGVVTVPPCGHIAGVYARTDHARGVHKAPANEILEGVLDLEVHVDSANQAFLNAKRVNCLRVFPGRGIRVWGARTLSGHDAWTYVNVRRLFLTAARWIDWHMQDLVFEPNDRTLWARIEREVSTYFYALYRKGALRGNTPQEAFYVKCNDETNTQETRDLGEVVAEIGLAAANPYEFVIVRLIRGARGVRISEPGKPAQNL